MTAPGLLLFTEDVGFAPAADWLHRHRIIISSSEPRENGDTTVVSLHNRQTKKERVTVLYT